MTRFQPSPERVLIKQTDDIVGQKSLILRPDNYRNKECARCGIVMAVGDIESEPTSMLRKPSWSLEVGDTVIFHTHEALELDLDSEKFWVCNNDAVLGKLELEDSPHPITRDYRHDGWADDRF
jgi:co-chaperonin GroES (HSP10)